MTRSLAALLIGRTLADRYEIDELIGQGGMSLVYRAMDSRLHRAVAVKVISLPSESDHQHRVLRERLRREAAAAARVPPHPNVVQVYDYGTDSALDLDFIAMELLEGKDLKEILTGGPLPYGQAIRIIREAARGLSAGHRAGIVHRDVKPANIIVVGELPAGTVKLLDFGIAKALETSLDEDLTRAGQAPYSPAYASPEQLDPAQPVTAASDVYQLGVVAGELLSGERAVGGRAVRTARWEAVPDTVRMVVDTATQPLPGDRYPNAAAFAEALARAANPEEGTVLLAAAPAPESDATIAQPAGPAPRGVPHGAWSASDPSLPNPAPAAPIASRVAAPSGGQRRWIVGAVAVLALLLALQALTRGGDADPAPGELPLSTEIEALDEEFRELTEDANRNLREQAEEAAAP